MSCILGICGQICLLAKIGDVFFFGGGGGGKNRLLLHNARSEDELEDEQRVSSIGR